MSPKYKHRRYQFDKGLAVAQKLEIVASDPVLAALAEELPKYGETTNRSFTDARGMIVFGVASVLYGSDRRAEAEMAYHWPLLRPVLERAGIRTSPIAPSAASWQYFRDLYLIDEVLARVRTTLRALTVGMAQEMGFFPEPDAEHDWLDPDHRYTVYADGTLFSPASGVGTKENRKSRSRKGNPRVSDGVGNSSWAPGYLHVFSLARRPESRMRLVLDFETAKRVDDSEVKAKELAAALRSLRRLRDLAGDGLRHFVYDRALNSHRQVAEVSDMGILIVGKPNEVDAFSEWRNTLHSEFETAQLEFSKSFDGCQHRLAVEQGMLWNLKEGGDGWFFEKRADVASVNRYQRPDGTYGFVIGLRLRCGSVWHHLDIDLTAPFPVDDKRGTVNLATHLKAHPIADEELFSRAYSIRNDVESTFSWFKHHHGMGTRAGSFSLHAHEIDLMLLSIAVNALAWAEWRQDYAASTAGYRVTQCLISSRKAGV